MSAVNPQIPDNNFLQDKCAWETTLVNNGASADPLEMWYNYISWYEQNRANDTENKFSQALEKCLATFEYNEMYKQDARMIKLWMKYIDMQQNPLHLYQLLYQRNIGTQCSSFYIGWAHYFDSANALKQAESVYNLGFQAKALPIEDLQNAHTKFRLSISQRMLYNDNLSKKRAASNLVDQRNTITSLNPPEKKVKIDGESENFYNTNSSSSGYDENKSNSRPAQYNESTGYNNYQNSQSQSQSINGANFTNGTSNENSDTNVTNSSSTAGSEPDNQCTLNNSGYMIASSLNSVYDDSTNYSDESTLQPTTAQESESIEVSGINVPVGFARYARNHHEKFLPPLCLEEPYDPNRKCHYPKSVVYPGDGNEYSLEEIRGRKWEKRRREIVWSRQQLEAQRHQIQQQQLQEQQLMQRQQQLQMQQQQLQQTPVTQSVEQPQSSYNHQYQENTNYYNNQNNSATINQYHQSTTTQYIETTPVSQTSYHTSPQDPNQQQPNFHYQPATNTYTSQSTSYAVQSNNTQPLNRSTAKPMDNSASGNDLDDFEEQIEASTIRFFPNNGVNKTKTITIKFKKEKPSQNPVTSSPSSHKVPSTPSSSVTPTTHKQKKSKKIKHVEDSGFIPSSGSNSTDSINQRYYQLNQQYHSNQNNANRQAPRAHNIEDANLLLSMANVHSSSNEDSSQSYSYNNNQQQENQFSNDDSFSNSEFPSSFGNGIYYANDNSNATPIKAAQPNHRNYLNELKTSTPNNQFKLLKNHASNISNQNDDSMCSYTGEQNSYFLADSDDEVKQRRLEKALQTIDTHMAKTILDPFNSELCKAFLTKIDFPPRNKPEICHVTNSAISKLNHTKVASLGDATYHIEKEVGRGAYGAVYRGINSYTGDIVALKYQRPPNSWELYICTEIRKRISNHDVLPGFMGISSSILARNASVLISEFSQFGSLLDINNRIRQATTKVMHESLVMHFTSQILNVIDHLHKCKIIHADIKPDNFLLMKIPSTYDHVPSVRLIDFGCAIDMSFFKEGTQFKKVIQTDGFTCIEMQEGRPWSYQTDLFCVAGTVHVMLFGEYMQLVKKFGSEWDIKQKLPRYLKKNLWTDFFSKLLNIKDLERLPNLNDLKAAVDSELYNMESELQKHIRTLSNILHKR